MIESAVTQPAIPAPLNERSFRLFSYLRELTALNLTRVTDLSTYERFVWLADVPDNSSCFSILRGAMLEGDESVWIEIKKLVEPRPPAPPPTCEGWYSAAQLKNDAVVPTLHDRMQLNSSSPSEPATYVMLAERPAVARAWQTYLESQWQSWAKDHKAWRTHHEFYSSLFTIEQQVKRLGEAYELFVGIGLLTWITPTGERVRRHLVAARALLSFDSHSGTISLRAAAEGAKPTLEYDMLEPDARPEPNVIKACDAMVTACAEDVWGPKVKVPLKSWVNAMSDRGAFLDSIQPPETLSTHPVVTFAPALVLRRRTRRSLVTFLQNIAERLRAMSPADVPFGIQRLVEIVGEVNVPSTRDTKSFDRGSRKAPEREIYFPLPSNDEQRLIVERSGHNRGVLVQGPPGTGKSQTIANLICHLLAEGKRILVTSQTERALKVLQSKLPEEMQALCVTVLGADETALKNMERSVLGINERQTYWDPARNAIDIKRLEQDLLDLRESKSKAETRLRHLREGGYQSFSIAGNSYRGTAGQIAQQLEAERAERGWIEDAVPENSESPASDLEFRTLHETLLELPLVRRRECAQHVVIPTAISSIETFVELVRAERDAQARLNEFADVATRANAKQFGAWTTSERQHLRALVEAFEFEVGVLRQSSPDWALKAIHDSLSARSKPWIDLLTVMEAELLKLDGKKDRAFDRELGLPARDKTIVRGDAQALLEHLQQGGGLGWGPFRAKRVRQALYIIREVRVNGRSCDNRLIVEELVEHLNVERSIDVLWNHCAIHTRRVDGPLRAQLSELEQFVSCLKKVCSLVAAVDEIRAALRNKRGIVEPHWADDSAVSGLIKEIAAAEARHVLGGAQLAFKDALAQLEAVAVTPNAHPSVAVMIAAAIRRSAEEFAREFERTTSLLQDRERLSVASGISTRIRKTAPKLIGALEADPGAAEWLKRTGGFVAAWTFARASSWMASHLSGMDAATAELEVRRCEAKIAITLESLASANAWCHCLNRLTEAQRQHMIAWKDAIKRIGKGTGVRAHLHRQHAREHMDECRSAIPAWIMPFYRVAETTSDAPEPYDVVIVDEASQSGPEACVLMYLAKRCIIVGDDKQISPEAVGIERAQVDQLTEQYISDLPHNDSFGVESSLFSQAQIRFGSRIRLREHFRCMPEIIRFSNDLCYQDEPLLPLRRYSANRLKPIEVRHVSNGLREGEGSRIRNRNEATAIVDEIISCLRDPKYVGKTMGVISLLGESQSELIREMVVSRVEPREIEERELTFGDAYAFQGDERDIIFLSMVAAPNARNATLASSKVEQRFNVATSRARDQIWLFHSVTLEDLNTTDVRYRLLSYYLNPEAPPAFDPDWSKCESKFEETIGRIIHERGYRLIPQFEPFGRGGKRLDFLVEGMEASLAVECDGDAFHSAPDDVHNDLVRQRQLERCGWTFWRIRDSEFYWNRKKSMEPLWALLAKLGIEPRKKVDDPPQPPPPPQPETKSKEKPKGKTESSMDPSGPIIGQAQRPIVVPREFDFPKEKESKLVHQQTLFPFRSRPDLEPLDRCVLELLDGARRIETQALILDVVRRLALGASGRRTVEAALQRLEAKGLIRSGVNYVERRLNGGSG